MDTNKTIATNCTNEHELLLLPRMARIIGIGAGGGSAGGGSGSGFTLVVPRWLRVSYRCNPAAAGLLNFDSAISKH